MLHQAHGIGLRDIQAPGRTHLNRSLEMIFTSNGNNSFKTAMNGKAVTNSS
jgi:hypothetical protein